MEPEETDEDLLELMQQGWIAGYPPWFHRFWLGPSGCRSDEEKIRLLSLLRSIEDGKPEDTRRLLPGIDPNTRLAVRDRETESLLEWAAEQARHPDCFRALVAAGADVSAPGVVSRLVAYGRRDLLQDALAAGADPNGGPDREPPLTSACWQDRATVKLLLDAGARTDATTTVEVTRKRSVAGVTPLMIAAWAGALPIVNLLLQRGADAQAVDSAGGSAIAWARASRSRARIPAVVAALEAAGAASSPNGAALPEPVDFGKRAAAPEYREALARARKLTRSAGKRVELEEGPLPGVQAFRIRRPESAADLLEQFRPEADSLGAMAFLSDDLFERAVPYLVVMPTRDYAEAVLAFETPVGQEMDSHGLVEWLRQLEKDQPFLITHLRPDLLRARFTTPVKNAAGLAAEIARICPDGDEGDRKSLERRLQETRTLTLWWD